jgi:hypothetical protein
VKRRSSAQNSARANKPPQRWKFSKVLYEVPKARVCCGDETEKDDEDNVCGGQDDGISGCIWRTKSKISSEQRGEKCEPIERTDYNSGMYAAVFTDFAKSKPWLYSSRAHRPSENHRSQIHLDRTEDT